MATPKGNYTAYQRLEPIQTNFGQIAREQEEMEFRYRAEQRAIAEKRQEKRDKIAANFNQDYSTLTDVVTNNRSIDEAFARGVANARDTMGQIYREIQSNPKLSDDVNTQMKLQNLKNYSKNLKLVSDRYTEYAGTVSTGMQDGSLSEWNSNTLSDLDSIFRQANLDVRVDPNTGLPIGVIAEVDEDGNVVYDEDGEAVLKELNLVEVLDGRGLNDVVSKFDLSKSVMEIGDKAGKKPVKSNNGDYQVIEYQRFSDIRGKVQNLVRGFIGSDGSPTDVAKSIWSDYMGNAPKELTPEDMQSIEDFYVESISTFYDEKYENYIDYSAQTAAEREARLRAKEAEEGETSGPGLELRTDEEGKPITESPVGVSGDLGGGGYSFTIDPEKNVSIGPKGQNITVDNLFLTNSGKLVYSGSQMVGKVTGKPAGELWDLDAGKFSEPLIENRIDGGLNVSEMNEVARQLGLRNAQELKDEMQRVKDQQLRGGAVPSEDAKKKAQELINKYKNKS